MYAKVHELSKIASFFSLNLSEIARQIAISSQKAHFFPITLAFLCNSHLSSNLKVVTLHREVFVVTNAINIYKLFKVLSKQINYEA